MSDEISLKEQFALLEKQKYFLSLPERLCLANEFLRAYEKACNEVQYKKNKDTTPAITALFDLETVLVKKRENAELSIDDQYEVILPKEELFNSNADYSNFAYGAPDLFGEFGFLIRKFHPYKIHDLKKEYKDRFAVYTVSRILFHIVFGVHPFAGREYYSRAVVSKEWERDFFKAQPKFIFEEGKNPNGFVNGYHEPMRRFWSLLEQEHRNFFLKAWAGEYDIRSLIEDWRRIYVFDISEVRTPCGEKLPALVFNKKNFFLFTETEMTRNPKLFCSYCKESLTERCSNCDLPKEQRCARPFTVDAYFVTKGENEETGEKVTKEAPFLLFPKQKITTDDFAAFGMEHSVFQKGTVFTVAASKKYDKLGLRYHHASRLYAECGSEHAWYEKDNVISLFPGIVIYLSETHQLVVPGTPPVLKKQVSSKPTEKAQTPEREEEKFVLSSRENLETMPVEPAPEQPQDKDEKENLYRALIQENEGEPTVREEPSDENKGENK